MTRIAEIDADRADRIAHAGTPAELEDALLQLLEELTIWATGSGFATTTYATDQMMTHDRGIVIRSYISGKEFRLSIHEAR